MTKQESSSRPKRAARTRSESAAAWPPALCPRCGGPILEGQNVEPLFTAKLVTLDAHPVLSSPPTIRGMVSVDGSGSRHDLTLHEQLIQRASMVPEAASAPRGSRPQPAGHWALHFVSRSPCAPFAA
jgi:hypothetical protein